MSAGSQLQSELWKISSQTGLDEVRGRDREKEEDGREGEEGRSWECFGRAGTGLCLPSSSPATGFHRSHLCSFCPGGKENN